MTRGSSALCFYIGHGDFAVVVGGLNFGDAGTVQIIAYEAIKEEDE